MGWRQIIYKRLSIHYHPFLSLLQRVDATWDGQAKGPTHCDTATTARLREARVSQTKSTKNKLQNRAASPGTSARITWEKASQNMSPMPEKGVLLLLDDLADGAHIPHLEEIT